jgi:hypothetical protein
MLQSKVLSSTFDLKLVTKAFILLFIVSIPFSYVHEIGHAIPCVIEGKDFTMNITLFGSSLQCLGDVDNKPLFRMAGGLLALIVSLVPYIVFRKTIDRYPYISIVLLSMTIGQASNMVIETAMYDNYISNGILSMISINLIQFIAFIYLAYRFSKKGINKKEGYLQTSFINHLEQSNENRHEDTIRQLSDYLQSVKGTNYIDSKLANNAIKTLDNQIKLLSRQIQIKKLNNKLHELNGDESFASKLHKVFAEINLARDIIFDDMPRSKTKGKNRSKRNGNNIYDNDFGWNPKTVFDI